MSEAYPALYYPDWIQRLESEQLIHNPLLKKDTWHTVEDLGLKINEHHKCLTLKFGEIDQDWLKLLSKIYILLRSRLNLSAQYLRNQILYLKRFSQFLKHQSIYSAEQIDNQCFENFDYYLRLLNLSESSISLHYTTLNNFFLLCRREGWLEVNTYWFEGRRRGRTSPKNDEIEYIPEEVWHQLEQHLHYLPEPIQRMVLVIKTTGMRIGELLNLPLDCLRKRGNQWRLRLMTEKYQTEDELPISPELVTVIKEQQEYIRKHFGHSYQKLFCSNNYKKDCDFSPAPRVMTTNTFNRWLNQLSQEQNICSKDGQNWHFKSHQFRKTVATIMTNTGVRDLIIQKYLRHRSPDMQNYYKHLLKQVLGDEYQELIKAKKYVDNTGKIVTSHQPKNPLTELLRRKMYQITTQYGECHRPLLKSPCQTVNACWRCQHWRTSTDDLNYLKDDLKRVAEELTIAEKLGMVRQQQGLEDDHQSLVIRIQGLEEIND